MAADWSHLPKELLHLISERLDSPLYLLRFRSVCSAWRSSAVSPLIPDQHFPFTVPPISTQHHAPSPFSIAKRTLSLSKRTLVLITPPPHQHTQTQTPWLVKIGKNLYGQNRLYHPSLRDIDIQISNFSDKMLLDFYHLRVVHLGNQFVLHYSSKPPFPEKVVAASTSQAPIVLAIQLSRKLALFRSGDEGWTVIPDEPIPMPYDDVCVFKDRPCAVDGTGRTVAVGSDLTLDLIAEAVADGYSLVGRKKLLVESEGGLLLVDKHMSYVSDDDYDEHRVSKVRCQRPVRFDVFRLDEKGKRWVKVTSLGDRILFLEGQFAFSVSALDLSGIKATVRENCVLFEDNTLKCGIGVFDLATNLISPLSYSGLLWPLPDWVNLHCKNYS